MKRVRYDSQYIKEPIVLCLGTFDGLHIGHQRLIREGKRVAEKNDYKTAVYSFENLPTSYLFRETQKKNIFTHHEKLAAFKRAKVDYLWLDFFDNHIANVSPKDYIVYLLKVLNIKHMVVGFNYSFGKQASGGPAELEAFGKQNGFDVTILSPVTVGSIVVSSTQIRNYLNNGEIGKVNAMLGMLFAVSGIVIHGKHVGSSLGFPTINLHQEEHKLLPKCGVYATITTIDGIDHQSITNIGVRPTFYDNGELTVETHILDYDQNCYGKTVTVNFVHFISKEVKLSSREELKEKIKNDVILAKKYFSKGK